MVKCKKVPPPPRLTLHFLTHQNHHFHWKKATLSIVVVLYGRRIQTQSTSSEIKVEIEFERKKQEILAAQNVLAREEETSSAAQPSQLNEMDIRVQSVGGKKQGRVKGLGSLVRTVKASNQSTSTLLSEIDEMIRSQVNASNIDLYA
ncbi:uncharacterized protein LOC129899865 [Solanum dulcamara]|uniref:uncharacterized protein LOC129899865 n=1 Tax=Solanum dulcamara TaxID=45834 RepID=UPI0024865725|nr:uncharacterized protein LOC129899865 [Solanum dulcamara]